MSTQRLTVGMTVSILLTTIRTIDGNEIMVRAGTVGTVASVIVNGLYRVDFPGAPGFVVGAYLLRVVVTA